LRERGLTRNERRPISLSDAHDQPQLPQVSLATAIVSTSFISGIFGMAGGMIDGNSTGSHAFGANNGRYWPGPDGR
jgi:hypothetical protein